jgi:hypothetical protein
MIRSLNQLRSRKNVCPDPQFNILNSLVMYKTIEADKQVELWAGEGAEIVLEDGNLIFQDHTGANDTLVSPPQPPNVFPQSILIFAGIEPVKTTCLKLEDLNKPTGQNTSTNTVQEPCKKRLVSRLRIASFTRLR